jgi:predicted negative regulator of RcsB-dependent stress response
MASRPRRKPQPEPDDIVLARALEFAEWAKRNIRLIIAGGVAVFLLLGGFMWYRFDREQRMERAAIEFLQLEQSAAMADPAVAVRDLETFVRRFEGTPYADEARVMLAQAQLETGQPAQAIETLGPVADRLERSPVGAQAAMLLGAAHETAGQPEEAVRTYLRVADGARMVFRRQEALLAAASIREQAGDYSGAAELYSRLVATAEEGTMERSIFEMRLAEAEAQARAQ